MNGLLQRRPVLLPSMGVAISGALWGLFWIPVRAIDDAGIRGGWATLTFNIIAIALLLPVAIIRWRRFAAGGRLLLTTGLLTGAAFTFYAASLLFTEVVRALLLFYLTPVWSTLLGRVLLDERITRSRVVALVLGVAGLLVLFGFDGGLPWPRNAGDWLALISGIAWAYGSLRIYRDQQIGAFESVFTFFIAGTLVALAVIALPLEGNALPPTFEALRLVAVWLPITVSLLVLPSVFLIIWGAGTLSPGRLGILLMLEIVVGIVSAALWAGEPFGARELASTLLIFGAGLVEVTLGPKASGAGAS